MSFKSRYVKHKPVPLPVDPVARSAYFRALAYLSKPDPFAQEMREQRCRRDEEYALTFGERLLYADLVPTWSQSIYLCGREYDQ